MLKNLKIWQKLMLIGIAFSAPIIILFILLIGQLNAQVDLAERERRGAEYVLAARAVLKNLQEHRGASTAFLAGDAAFRDRAAKEQSDVDAALQALETLDKKFGAELKTTEKFNALKTKWQDVKNQVASRIKPEDNITLHNKLIAEQFSALLFTSTDESGLLLDPEPDVIYTVLAFGERLPELNETLGQARALGTLAAIRKSASAADKQQLALLLGRARVEIEALTRSTQNAMGRNPKIEANLKTPLQESLANTNVYLDLLDKRIINATTIDLSATEFFDIATKGIETNFKLGDTMEATLQDLLLGRINGVNQARVASLALVILSLALASALIILIVRSITQPIAQLVDVTDRISLGELDARIGIDSRDEIGALAESVGRMQASLQAAIERLRARRSMA